MKLNQLTIIQAHQGLKQKDFSASELTQACLEKIEQQNPKINAFISVSQELALAQAYKVDQKISQGDEINFLEGIPLALKDNLCLRDSVVTAGSKMLENYRAPYTASVVEKLSNQGSVFLGKTNMDEFAMGSSTETSAFGITRNPHNFDHTPGGSSGGSSAAVSAEMALASLGSDTGGSIRQPASFCGLVGFKPTYGLVSRYGLMAMSSSLDQIGPITRNVDDARQIFRAIYGKDSKDSTTLDPSNLQKTKPKTITFGILKEALDGSLNKENLEVFQKNIKRIEKLGYNIKEVSIKNIEKSLACYYVIMPAEVSSNLGRFNGVLFGHQDAKAKNLEDYYKETRDIGFGSEVKRRIILGTFVLSSGYREAYYKQAQKVRQEIKNSFDKAFENVDFIISPTTPTPAFKLGEKISNPLEMYLSDIYTCPANLAGLPAISIPSGEVNKLPVGLQIMGPQLSDEILLEVAQSIELK